jgi:hypothetical protein
MLTMDFQFKGEPDEHQKKEIVKRIIGALAEAKWSPERFRVAWSESQGDQTRKLA